MDFDQIRGILEEQDINSDKIDEILISLRVVIPIDEKAKMPSVDEIIKLKLVMDNETDWKKRAALAARIISISLE